MTDRIFFRGITLFGRHGVFAEEQTLGQRFVVDLDCWLDLRPAGASDRTADTVNYTRIYEAVRAAVEDERFALIEALAQRIAARILAAFPPIASVRVEVRKPSAPIQGHFDTVGVEITRTREAEPG
jgi:7,8-dihydroneopterin aldolase/epimerase/oxygenase